MSKIPVSDITIHLTKEEAESLHLMLCLSAATFQLQGEAALKANDLETAHVQTERKRLAVMLANLISDLTKLNRAHIQAQN